MDRLENTYKWELFSLNGKKKKKLKNKVCFIVKKKKKEVLITMKCFVPRIFLLFDFSSFLYFRLVYNNQWK